MMNTYTEWLNLEFDPFAPSAKSRDFYCSGHRQQILDQIVEFSLYSNAMIAVTGPIGAGKTTLAANFCDRFADEAVCVKITATLFMNQNQFLDSLQDALEFRDTNHSDIDSSIEQICQFAAELDLEARSLILIIDDAHELSAEVLQLLTQLLESCVDSSIHALLFGENQLDSLLQSTLPDAAQERLAVFPLEGFASQETHEYIRFKLATARFTKDLPIGGGIIGAIHNSSQGMPGEINSLIADALNAAAPASAPETDEFSQMSPMYSGERIEQLDVSEEFETFEIDEPEVADRDESEQAWVASIQPRYWAAAATLVVLLTGTLLFWDSAPGEKESLPITVAVTPTATQAEEPAPSVEPEPIVATIAEPLIAEVEIAQPEISSTSAESVTRIEETIVAEADLSVSAPELVAQAEEVASIVEPIVEPIVESIVEPTTKPLPAIEPAATAKASPFEENLLQSAPSNFAVQLLASHSEANVSEFVAQLDGDHPAGYFETRYQGKPWFVAVLGAFDDRDQASRAIASLPARLRSNEPWIRSVSGIQSDIRELLGANLVSVK